MGAGFEEWLGRRIPRPVARESFALEQRKRFLAGFQGTGEPLLSRSRTPEALRKQGVFRHLESLGRCYDAAHEPREGFRNALRERFVSGIWDADAASTARDRFPLPAAGDRSPGLAPRGRLLRWLPAAAVLAAAAAAVFFFVLRPVGTPWRVVSVDDTARVSAAGHRLDLSEKDVLAGLTDAEDGFLVADGNLRLSYGDSFRMQVQPGTRVALDRSGGSALKLFRGEVFLQTFAGYPGEGLTVETPETMVSVHGTTLGVRADDEGTCVCVLEGLADVYDVAEADHAAVGTCSRHLVFHDGTRPPADSRFPRHGVAPDPVYEQHLAPLRSFYEDAWR